MIKNQEQQLAALEQANAEFQRLNEAAKTTIEAQNTTIQTREAEVQNKQAELEKAQEELVNANGKIVLQDTHLHQFKRTITTQQEKLTALEQVSAELREQKEEHEAAKKIIEILNSTIKKQYEEIMKSSAELHRWKEEEEARKSANDEVNAGDVENTTLCKRVSELEAALAEEKRKVARLKQMMTSAVDAVWSLW